MENNRPNPERTMSLKESNQFLAEVLHHEGVDIYKRSVAELKQLHPTIVEIRKKIDEVLRDHFQTSFAELDSLSPSQLREIRHSFLGHYKGSVEQAEKLKKWLPLNQLVGYTEVLVASSYLQLNSEIDADLRLTDIENGNIPLEHVRLRILNAYKKINQGSSWEQVQSEVEECLDDTEIYYDDSLFEKWRASFEAINHPLQTLYTEHLDTMHINQAVYDLQYREEKRSEVLNQLIGQTRRNWKPADLTHDIHAQSAEANRSIIELTCNAIDANSSQHNKVEISLDDKGYTVRDTGSGMNPYVILEKLIIPKVSGKTGKETIGRFGVGFYTVLSHLKDPSDMVRIETHDGNSGHIIEFKIHERTGDIFVHTERNDSLQQGTAITVRAENFDRLDAENLLRELLAYNNRAEIRLNQEVINQPGRLEKLKGSNTEIQYSAKTSDRSKVSLLVNGVAIESFDVEALNVCQELALDFPLTCSLPESRSELAVDKVAIAAVKEIITTALSAEIEDQQKVAICNALYPVLEKLQARSRSPKRKDNLPGHLKRLFGDKIESENSVFLPNTPAFEALDIPGAVFVDTRLSPVNLEEIPGISRCRQFNSDTGYRLYIAPFKPGYGQPIAEDGKILVLDQAVWEQHRNSPAALNMYWSNLDTTGQNDTERKKGDKGVIVNPKSATLQKETQQVSEAWPEQVTELGEYQSGASNEALETRPLDERLETIFGILKANVMTYLDRQKFEQLATIPESQLASLVKQRLLETYTEVLTEHAKPILDRLKEQYPRKYTDYLADNAYNENFEEAGFLEYMDKIEGPGHSNSPVITEEQKDRVIFEIEQLIRRETSIIGLDQKIEELLSAEIRMNFSFYTEELALYKWLHYFKPGQEKMFSLYTTSGSLLFEKSNAKGYGTGKNYFERAYVNNLICLDRCLPLGRLQQVFEQYDEQYFISYVEFMANFLSENPIGTDPYDKSYDLLQQKINQEMLARADHLFQNKILDLSLDEILEFVVEINYLDFFKGLDKIDLAKIKRSHRGYLLYILEGGEILNERDFVESEVKESTNPTRLLLSSLVQGKKDNTSYFQEFAGRPEQLAEQVQTTQKGVDPSKALREIMHSTKNQVVNDGYLWIREILQNSLDAVRKNQDRFAEPPQVSIDTYLRRTIKQASSEQIWQILNSAITKYYPKHLFYFRKLIDVSGQALTNETFAQAVEKLGASSIGTSEYFPKEFAKNLHAEFEALTTVRELVVQAADPVGMDLHTVINYLLIPNESSKKDDPETVGKFGQGFFTIFGDSTEVQIKTSLGNGTTDYITVKPIKDQAGNIIDFEVNLVQTEEQFQGTVIQKVMDTDLPEIEAAFCKSAAMSYGGLLDRQTVQINFRDQEINKPRAVLATTEVPGFGTMKIYDARENSMTQGGLFVKNLDEEIWSTVPEKLRTLMEKQGIVLDIPASVQLIKSRADIAKKQEVMPRLTEHLPSLLFQAYLGSVIQGKADLFNIPYDYFEGSNHRYSSPRIQKDAETIVSSNTLPSYSYYMNNEDALTTLLTLLPCVEIEGQKISIAQLADRIDQDPESVNLDILPKSLQDKISYSSVVKRETSRNQRKARQEYGATSTMVMYDRPLPENSEVQNKASAYYAYNQLARFVLDSAGAPAVQLKYYLEVGQSSAHAYQNSEQIGFNLTYLEKQLPQLVEIMEQRLPAEHPTVQRFFEELIRLCTHERQHNLEGTEETAFTHNDVFFAGQREVLLRFLQNRNVDFQKLLDKLYNNFSPTFIPAKQLMEYMI